MKHLFIKCRRDMLQMWPQFLSVFMMAFISITIFSGMEGMYNGLKITANDYYNETNLADAWVYGSDISQDMLHEVKQLDDVKDASLSMALNVNVETGEKDNPDLKLMTLSDENVCKPKLMEGKEYTPDSEGVWVDESFAKARNLSVGTPITISYLGMQKEVTIEGLILDSEFIYYTGSATETIPNSSMHGYAIISEKQAVNLFGKVVYNEMRLSLNEGANTDNLTQNIKNILGDAYYSFALRDDIPSVSQIIKETSQIQTMGQLFSSVFILLALLTMYTTMSRIVDSQIIQIGTLKALGITKRQIRLHYSMYGFFVSLIGGVCGFVTGRLLVSNALMKVKKATLTLPEWNIKVSPITYILIGSIALICVLASVIAANKSLKGMPAETMRGEVDTKLHHNKKQSKNTMSKLSFEWKWIFRGISVNKVRFIMGMIGVAGSMMLMMAGFGIKNSIDYSNQYVFNTEYSYRYKGVLSQKSEKIYNQIESSIGEHQWLYESNVTVNFNREKKTGVVTVLDSGNYVYLEDMDRHAIDLPPSGVVISHKLSQLLGIKKGDSIALTIPGIPTPISCVVQNITYAPSPQGVFLSKEAWQGLSQQFMPTSILIGSDADYTALSDMNCFKEITPMQKQADNMNTMAKSAMSIVALLILASIVLSTVILYNLGMLNFVERTREFATMKVLGFHQNEIRSMVLKDGAITTVIGWLLGIPAGYIFLNIYISVVSFTSFEWIATLLPFSLALVSLLVIGCCFGVTLFISHKVKKINMVEALKSVE